MIMETISLADLTPGTRVAHSDGVFTILSVRTLPNGNIEYVGERKADDRWSYKRYTRDMGPNATLTLA